jgi:uncharacterized protein YqeY
MAELTARLRHDLTMSRKARDKSLTLLLGTILADVNNRALELNRAMSDDDVLRVIRSGIKKRREAVAIYGKAGRPELAEREGAEAAVLERYLPAEVSSEEIRTAIQTAIAEGAATLGAVMSRVMPVLKGRADGARINAIAREELAARR